MAFKRMEGFAGSVPQGFIDRNLKICPFCGSSNPHWALDQKMQMKLEGNLYLFKCEQCDCIISSPVADVTGFNKTALTTTGLLKKMSGKKNNEIYMRLYNPGSNEGLDENVGREYTLSELNEMAMAKDGSDGAEKKFY